ncbi:hypothetical protein JCM14244_12960 [Venenivibrio stagnispumantis]|uniref:Predicted Fe-Mo cluster-binding protein, NifX family n=1 Tax=Venenivibrio stagnispumantis TaxID=407998 RepID=A0AA45WMW0_9AQUI|nr:NifB/NifX family molybdenum-iron cluster-binding protein [Venenivibrio stagnispumantis]MCW4573758.1 hypothetical protein [Venenivibrio stagnispumantis]SMP15168.1 Predicted Fe-Mo cluster-binding protein, NifX family [Venenivibrio stagnispumantis]
MKIGIPVKPDSKDRTKYVVSDAFGRARLFAIIDENSNIEIIKAEETGGRNIANILSKNGVKVVLTTHLGGGAFEVIKSLGMKAYKIPAGISIEQAISDYKNGLLPEIKEVSSCGHHHHH